MLLCSIDDVRPGMVIGAPVVRPEAPDVELLRPGVSLDGKYIARLRAMDVRQLWVEDDVTRDLDMAVATHLTAAKLAIYKRLKEDIGAISRKAVTVGQVQGYRRAITGMVMEAMSNEKYSSLAETMLGADGQTSHAVNVAYLSVLAGLELETYLAREQPRLSRPHAQDATTLGLAGMLHDIGKSAAPSAVRDHHEVHTAGGETTAPEGYADHPIVGSEKLRESRVPARVINVVLHHHQRFDGSGWPDMARVTSNRREGTQAGHRIHIFTRIVAAANVLDNLLWTADGSRLPPVAALHAFASERFHGWFDPKVRRALLRRLPPFAIGSQVRLSDGREAVVIAPNLDDPCRPVVRSLERPATPDEGAPLQSIELADAQALSVTHYLGIDVTAWLYQIPDESDSVAAAA